MLRTLFLREGSGGVLVRHAFDDQKVPGSNHGFGNIFLLSNCTME